MNLFRTAAGESVALLEKDISANLSVGSSQKSADQPSVNRSTSSILESSSVRLWFPELYDVETIPVGRHSVRSVSHPRSIKRRLFLILTEPDTSVASASFFGLLVVTITLMNIVMILQTMQFCQYTPLDCEACGGKTVYPFDNDDPVVIPPNGAVCQCPPEPFEWTSIVLQGLVYFFTIEWFLRVLSFEPALNERSKTVYLWVRFITSPSVVLDALAVFPYYIEAFSNSNGLMSLRLLRLFRVFQVLRLGQYNDSFKSLTAVMIKALPYLKLLIVMLLFGAAFFGSMLYWVEKGEWKFFEQTQSYQYVRLDQHGQEEISPFSSIASAFWWFLVTASTVGYGDTYPTSTVGRWIASMAMLMGILVIAFPVSVFSDLWSKELRIHEAFDDLEDDGLLERNQGKPEPVSGEILRQTTSVMLRETGHIRQASLDSLPNNKLISDDAYVMMTKEDLKNIMNLVFEIHESQSQIKCILRKYKVQ